MIAQSLIRHKAVLHWADPAGWGHAEVHTAWTAREAATKAYRRAVSMLRAGQATAYTTRHYEEVVVQ